MPDKPSKQQEQPKPQEKPESESTVPPRQNDPLLSNSAQKLEKPTKETKQK